MTWEPGTTSVVDSTTAQHLAFPFALTTQAGTHVATYRVGTAHGVQPSGYVVASRSTDDAQTWLAPVVLSNCEGDERSAKLAQADDGTIYAAVWAWRTTDKTSIRSMLRTSADDGASWSYPQPLGFPHTSWSAATGLVWHDGRLIAAAYGSDGAGEYVALSDGTVVASGGGNWQEPALTAHGSELLCFLRYEYGTTRRIYLSRSADGGSTWTAPARIVDGGGQPAPFVAPDGTWLLAYRDTASSEQPPRWAWSGDDGATWVDGGVVRSGAGRYVYADWIALPEGPGLVYALESGDHADVYLTRFVQPAPTPLPSTSATVTLSGPVSVGGTVDATLTIDGVDTPGQATIESITEGPPLSIGIIASAYVQPSAGASYEDEVLADSPAFYYKADETSGTTLVDGGGTKDGTIGARTTLQQSPLVSDGGYSHLISRTGSGNTFIADDTSGSFEMTNAGDYTVEIWVKLTSASGDALQTIIDKTSLSSSYNQWGIWYDNRSSQGSPQRLRAFIDGQSMDWAGSAAASALEAGVHLVLVKDGSDAYFYVDADEKASVTSVTWSMSANNISVNIGQSGANTFYAGMNWDWFAYYESALTPARVTAHYNAGTA